MFYSAISTGDVVIVRNNRIIGSGKVSCVKGIEFASIRLEDSLSEEFVPDALLGGLDRKYLPFHFHPISGQFIGVFENDPSFDEVNENLWDVYAVDAFNLRYGMVPNSFNNCEGYRSYDKE